MKIVIVQQETEQYIENIKTDKDTTVTNSTNQFAACITLQELQQNTR